MNYVNKTHVPWGSKNKWHLYLKELNRKSYGSIKVDAFSGELFQTNSDFSKKNYYPFHCNVPHELFFSHGLGILSLRVDFKKNSNVTHLPHAFVFKLKFTHRNFGCVDLKCHLGLCVKRFAETEFEVYANFKSTHNTNSCGTLLCQSEHPTTIYTISISRFFSFPVFPVFQIQN